MAKKKNTIPSGFEGILDNIFTNPEEGEGVTNIDDMNTEIVSELNSMNPTNLIDCSRERMCDAIPKCSSLQDYLLITNGHDFVNLFCKVTNGHHGQNMVKAIEATMRGTFSIEDFKSTDLYKSLLAYQNSNNLTIVPEVA